MKHHMGSLSIIFSGKVEAKFSKNGKNMPAAPPALLYHAVAYTNVQQDCIVTSDGCLPFSGLTTRRRTSCACFQNLSVRNDPAVVIGGVLSVSDTLHR